jgi:hypothetical protein
LEACGDLNDRREVFPGNIPVESAQYQGIVAMAAIFEFKKRLR